VAYVFHAGDGNVHPHLFFDPADEAQRKAVLLASKAISRLAVELGGVLSGEHGIGLEKRDLMSLQFSPADLEPMAWVQHAVDPMGLANPCKLLPHASCCGGKAPPETPMALGGWRPEALAKHGLWV
jgi:glycolate oxidase